MTPRHLTRWPAAALGLTLAGLLGLSLARAEPPADPPKDAPKEAAKDAPKADVEERAIDFEPIPPAPEKPLAPKEAEWRASAVAVKFTARGPRAKNCRLLRLREWLKVRCEAQITAISLLGGNIDRAYFWLPQQKEGEPSPTSAEVIFPIKPGDRRIIELFSFGPAYGGSMISPGPVLQEHWIAGEPAPTVVIR